MKKIVVVGSINMDISLKVPHIPKVGETIIADALIKSGGGKGANQAVAIARLDGDVTFIGRVGDDENGRHLIENMEAFGVKTNGIVKDANTQTGSAYISVSHEGENNIVVYPGANFAIDKNQLIQFEYLIAQSDYCVMQMEIPMDVIAQTIDICKKNNVSVILNPAPAKQLTEYIIQNADFIIPNETELLLLSKTEGDYEKMAKALWAQGAKNVIVTLGEKGCLWVTDKTSEKFEPMKVNAVDTTAAGDSFIGGFVTGLSQGYTIKKAIGFATAVAALTVTVAGAQNSLPRRDAVESFINSQS